MNFMLTEEVDVTECLTIKVNHHVDGPMRLSQTCYKKNNIFHSRSRMSQSKGDSRHAVRNFDKKPSRKTSQKKLEV